MDLERILAGLGLPAQAKETLIPRLTDSVSLWRAGEPQVALENLCDNLFEFEVAIDQRAREELIVLCRRFAVSPKRIALLQMLASSDGHPQ
jgi:hypothetical protein